MYIPTQGYIMTQLQEIAKAAQTQTDYQGRTARVERELEKGCNGYFCKNLLLEIKQEGRGGRKYWDTIATKNIKTGEIKIILDGLDMEDPNVKRRINALLRAFGQ